MALPYFKIAAPAPINGYIDARTNVLFTWLLLREGTGSESLTVTSMNMRWREQGQTQEHVINAPLLTKLEVPANTFPAHSGIEYQLQVTADNGEIDISPSAAQWWTISTVEATSSATAQYPSGVIVSEPTATFRWKHTISTGTAPTGFDLQKSDDGSAWETLTGTGAADNLSAEVDMTAFTAGEWFWRVRTYNTNSVAGSWSPSAKFIRLAEPPVPSVSVERASPRWAISWQAADQEAYEIELDGEVVGYGFGSANRFKATELTPYGEHIVRLRVQNQYSLWSAWAEAALPISGQPVGEVILTAMQPDELPKVTLLADTLEASESFVWYRDGARIAETAGGSHIDNLGAGAYIVRAVLDAETGDYIDSDAVTVTLTVRDMVIYDIKGDRWISLALSSSSAREVGTSTARAVTLLHRLGDRRPYAEYSTAEDRTVSFECAFLRGDAQIEQFEALINSPVRLVQTDGSDIIGVMTSYQRSLTRFYVTYTATVTEAEI